MPENFDCGMMLSVQRLTPSPPIGVSGAMPKEKKVMEVVGRQLVNGKYRIMGKVSDELIVEANVQPCTVISVSYPIEDAFVVKTNRDKRSILVKESDFVVPMGKVVSWSVYRRNSPSLRMMQCADSTLPNHIYSIEPTLRNAGFVVNSTERDGEISPKRDALYLLPVDLQDCEQVVYWVWRHPRGYTEEINVAWKLKEKTYDN